MSILDLLSGKAMADQAWAIACKIEEHLDGIRNGVRELATANPKEFMAHKAASGQNAGGGAATVDIPLGTVPPDQEWTIQRFAATGPAGVEVAVYFDTAGDPTALKEDFTLSAAGRYADGVSNNLYCGENRQIIARAFAVPAGQTVTVSVQVLQKYRTATEEAHLTS